MVYNLELCWSPDVIMIGHPEYGCFISKEKTLTNFDYDAQGMNITGCRDTRKCGGSVGVICALTIQQTSPGVAYEST